MKREHQNAAMALVLCAALAGCGGQSAVTQTQAGTQVQAESQTQTGTETEGDAAAQETETVARAAADAGTTGAAGDEASSYVKAVENASIDAETYLDYAAGIEAGVYKWILSEDGDYYTLAAVDEEGKPIEMQETAINVGANNAERGGQGGHGGMPGGGKPEGAQGGMPGGMMFGGGGTVYQGVYMNANVTNLKNQTMAIYVPAAYMTVDAEGNVTGIDHNAKIGSYTADTAPIIYLNECGGWRSSSPRSCDTSYIEQGMIYVTAGARSRDAVSEDGSVITGKAPIPVVDLKSGVIALRANADVIPGNKDRIVSIGTSGGGQMSSILGASGNMSEYYPYLYEAGALGVTKNADGSFSSAIADNIYGAQLYCPIADIEDADLAYAWWWVDLADDGGSRRGSTMTAFERRLQELEADAFVEYLNSLELKDTDGNALTLDGLRSGTYYDAVLANVSDALNALVEAGEIDPAAEYPDASDWLVQKDDSSWAVTDLRGFMIGTGLVNNRNKAIPGFDTMDKSAENDAFGTPDQKAVHFSRSVAQILKDNYEELSKLDGFDAEQVDSYIEDALTGDGAESIAKQADLLNATEIMLGANGLHTVDPAQYWRDRSGTADQHTSFSVGYNILLAAQMKGLDVDYHLVWNMGHGSQEGSSTGTFIDWVNEICAK